MASRTDIAIVGAGPAGAWAAYRLARAGARVRLFDASHPREKVCGGGVTGRALTVVGEALDPMSLPSVVIRAARFVDSRSGRSAIVPLAAAAAERSAALVVASRTVFDGHLLKAARTAGAELVAARVLDVSAVDGGLRLRTSKGLETASVVIGCDGANSLVRRRLARPFRRDQISIACGFFAHGATSDEIIIELAADPAGYIWSFPRPSHLAIGICAQADGSWSAGRLKEKAACWIDGLNLAPNAWLQPYSWPIPSLSTGDFETLAVSGPRWALTGDAAGLVDPITREGIYFALRSADVVARALTSPRPDPFASYETAVRDEILPELAAAARLKSGFFKPAFTAILLDGLARSRRVCDVMADLIAGRQPYKSLTMRLAKTCEFGLAARVVRARFAGWRAPTR